MFKWAGGGPFPEITFTVFLNENQIGIAREGAPPVPNPPTTFMPIPIDPIVPPMPMPEPIFPLEPVFRF
jgi:hypothetical protein